MDDKLFYTFAAVILILDGIFLLLASWRLPKPGYKLTLGLAVSSLLFVFGSVILATFDWKKPETWQDTTYQWYERNRASWGYPVEKFPCYTEIPSTEVTWVVLFIGAILGLAIILLSEWRRTWLINNSVTKFDILQVIYTLIGVVVLGVSIMGMNYQEQVKKEIWEIQETVLDITDSPKRRSCLLQRRREKAISEEKSSWQNWTPPNLWPQKWTPMTW